jgi:putative redox protein
VVKPPVVADLTWIGELKFSAVSSQASMTLDSAGIAGPSPVQALVFSLAGCMAMDVAYILSKGRYVTRVLSAHVVADRSASEPHRLVSVTLHFTAEGDMPADAVGRAIALSHDKYCSVWHSMRQDIAFTTTYEVRA